jgi:hypothetical protein
VNWGAATVVLVLAAILEMIAIEVVRSIIHRRRERHDGLRGTQYIAMWGSLIGGLLLIAALICGAIWMLTR